MRARRGACGACAVLALAAVALVPKATASDASSASEGDRTALLVAGLGGVAAAALGAAATTGSGVDLAECFKGSSEWRSDAAYDLVFPKGTTATLTPKSYLCLDVSDHRCGSTLRYLNGLGGDDLAQNRLISAKRGAPLVNLAWSRAMWCEEEQETCSEKNRDSGIWKPRAFSSSRTNTCNKARMLCAAGESWLADENGKPLSPERFKLLEVMVEHEYIGFGPHDAMLVDMLHAFAHEETRALIDWDGTFVAGCFYGEKVVVALLEGLISFDEAGHVVNPDAIDSVGEQMAVATHVYTHDVRDVVTYAQTTEDALLAVRFMGMTGFGNRQTSPWFLFSPSDAWAADGALKCAGKGLTIPSILGAQKTPEYVVGLVADTYYSNAGAIVDLADGVKEEPRHIHSILRTISTVFNSDNDFVQRIQNGDHGKLRIHPRDMTPREVAAAERMGITRSDEAWPEWFLDVLRRKQPGFVGSQDYERLKVWPYWLIWIEIDCLSLWSGIVYEMVALDSQGRVMERARPQPFVHETTRKHFLAWGDAPRTRSDFDSYVDLDDEANRPTFLSADELREALDIEKSDQEKHAEGIGGVCNRHSNGASCTLGDKCQYAYHYGHENFGTFYNVGDKSWKHTDGKWYCKVCGAPWAGRGHCSDAETCPGGTWDKYHAIREACDGDDTKSYPAWWGKDYVPEGGVKIASPKVDAVRALTQIQRRALEPTFKIRDRVEIVQGHYQGRVGKVTKKSGKWLSVKLDPVPGETVPVTLKLINSDLVHVDDAAGTSLVDDRDGAGEEKKEEAGNDPAAMVF